MLRYITGLIAFLYAGNSWAQFDRQQVELDSLTYAQYLQQDWKNLVTTTSKAIHNDADFPLLNIRAAIASAALNKPYDEQYYLQRSYRDFPNDPLTLSLLYNNYLNIGQYPQALRINKQLQQDSSLKQYYPKRPPIHLAGIEVGFKRSSDSSLYKPLMYAQAGLGFRVKTIAFYNAFSYLTQDCYYGRMQQYQYYLSAMIPLKRNWTIAPAVHALYYTIQSTIPGLDANKLSATPFVLGINTSKLHRNFQYQLGAYYSTLNDENQLQLQPGITWFPLSGNTLSLNVTGNYLTENGSFTTSATANVMLNKYFSLTAAYLNANTRYYTEQNGFLVNNSYDITGSRYVGMLSFHPTINWTVYAVYLRETKRESTFDIPYNFDTGVLGIRRTF
ncbi:MAG: hypothetical protein V4590_12600 [Bacteroidota bacterium]